MSERYYDVVVVGSSLGARVAAALLARRDFTVLSIDHGARSADYAFEGRVLRRRAFSMLAESSPVWSRVVGELAHSQAWRRQAVVHDPALQVVAPGLRFSLRADADGVRREVEREFPEARRLIAELYANFARVGAAADAAFERDAVWPPGGFFERRETGRLAAALPYARAEPHADLLSEFPRRHVYRKIVRASVRLATHLATDPPAFAAARLHSLWARGAAALDGGARELDEVLVERMEANGGSWLAHETVASLEVKRGRVTGVHIDGDTRPIGAGVVISDLTGEEVAELTDGRGISKRAQREWPRVRGTTGRFVVSVIARREGLPDALGRDALFLPRPGHADDRVLHVQRTALDDGEDLLVLEALVPERDDVPLTQLRRRLLERVCHDLPYLEQHLVLVDSVHDGLPLWRYRVEGQRVVADEVERTRLQGARPRAEPMGQQLEVDPPGYLGLGGEPLRGPTDRSLLVGRTVLPGLGQEGELLAGCSAARIVTKSDRRKARVRREMWTKIEIT